METKWLEDFVSLAQTHSFSRSAELRHVTQPAFSRRIQSLEAWLGADLIDRTSYPTRLTHAGEIFFEQAIAMLSQINNSRALLRSKRTSIQSTVDFAVPHNLSLTFVPKWLSHLHEHFGEINSRLLALNVHDAVMSLTELGFDLILCYHNPQQPLLLDPAQYDMISMGTETLRAYAKANKEGQPIFQLPGTIEQPLPFLSYASNAYLGRMTDLILQEAGMHLHLDKCYETDMAEGLKMMALEGRGIAFLPESAVARELKHKQLACADLEKPEWNVTMEIRLYREHPSAQRPGKPVVSALWAYLESIAKPTLLAVSKTKRASSSRKK